jgi:hypothetical protein
LARKPRQAAPPADRQTADAIWRTVGWVVGQSALLAALLLFFGWARTRATFAHFGVDLSLLEFSTTDYIIRSVNSAYEPTLRLGVVLLSCYGVHAGMSRAPGVARTVQLALGTIGFGLLVGRAIWSHVKGV